MPDVPNGYEIDYAKPGFCSLCHIEIAEFDGFTPEQEPRITRLKGNAASFNVSLDDGSDMRISSCKDCAESFSPEKAQELMESEARGWQWEVENLMLKPLPGEKKAKWGKKKAKEYLTEYRRRMITNTPNHPWGKEEKQKVKRSRRVKQLLWDRDI